MFSPVETQATQGEGSYGPRIDGRLFNLSADLQETMLEILEKAPSLPIDNNPALNAAHRLAKDNAAFLQNAQKKLAVQHGEMIEFMCIEDAKIENMSHMARLRLDFRRQEQATESLQTQRLNFIVCEQKVMTEASAATTKIDIGGLDSILNYRLSHTELLQEMRRLQLECATMHESVRSFRWSAKRIDEIRSIYKQKMDIKLSEFESQLDWLHLCNERDLDLQREIQAALLQRRTGCTSEGIIVEEALTSEFQLRELHTVALHRKGTEFVVAQQACLEKYERDTFDACVRAVEVQERLRNDSKTEVAQLEREHEQQLLDQKLRMTEEIERLEFNQRQACANHKDNQLIRFHDKQAKAIQARRQQEADIFKQAHTSRMASSLNQAEARIKQRQQDFGCHFASLLIMQNHAKVHTSDDIVDRYLLAPALHNQYMSSDSAVWGLTELFYMNSDSATDDDAAPNWQQYTGGDLESAQKEAMHAMVQAHGVEMQAQKVDHAKALSKHRRTWKAKRDTTMVKWRLMKKERVAAHLEHMSVLCTQYKAGVDHMLTSHAEQLSMFVKLASQTATNGALIKERSEMRLQQEQQSGSQ